MQDQDPTNCSTSLAIISSDFDPSGNPDNPLIRNVVLRRPELFAMDERPQVSLHLLVKNGESCIGRLLINVGPYIDEIVAVVNDTTDRTVDLLREYAEYRGSKFNLDIIVVARETHPGLYIMDVPETYAIGRPLAGEVYDGPFTGEPLLADWAAVRNLGWSRCTKDWILFLDVDDVVRDPEAIPGLCEALSLSDVEMGCTRYVYSRTGDGGSQSESYRERLVRNLPRIAWTGIVHEILDGHRKTAYIPDNLIVDDMKDNQGLGVRVPGRCFKVLYHDARKNNWEISARNLVYLAQEARQMHPDIALAALIRYLEISLWPEERAWACSMAGEIHESRKDYAKASEWYERSLAEHPGSKSAYRLCRSRFHESRWQDAVDAYLIGVENKRMGGLQLIDNGPVYEDMSKILVAAALENLGRPEEAVLMCQEALVAFPNNKALQDMLEGMVELLAKREDTQGSQP